MSELEHFRSELHKCGLDRANARYKMKAAGITKEEIYRPFIGIANSYTNIFAGHSMLDKITRAVSDGILMAGGTPVEFGTIGICDAICQSAKGMKYSLPSREVIANSVESMAFAHGLDAVVLVTACDKITPGISEGRDRRLRDPSSEIVIADQELCLHQQVPQGQGCARQLQHLRRYHGAHRPRRP